jgi:hypothetical protein
MDVCESATEENVPVSTTTDTDTDTDTHTHTHTNEGAAVTKEEEGNKEEEEAPDAKGRKKTLKELVRFAFADLGTVPLITASQTSGRAPGGVGMELRRGFEQWLVRTKNASRKGGRYVYVCVSVCVYERERV